MSVQNSALPEYLRVGVFNENKEYKIVLRYSSNDGEMDYFIIQNLQTLTWSWINLDYSNSTINVSSLTAQSRPCFSGPRFPPHGLENIANRPSLEICAKESP